MSGRTMSGRALDGMASAGGSAPPERTRTVWHPTRFPIVTSELGESPTYATLDGRTPIRLSAVRRGHGDGFPNTVGRRAVAC
jgi:hypothetical protein